MGNLEREIVWLGHPGNTIDLRLKSNDSYVDLIGVQTITLNFSGITLTSTNSTAQVVTWAKAGYLTGEVRINLGSQSTLISGEYDCRMVVYDLGDTAGVVWGDSIPLLVKSEVEV
uniref:Uncharacterized protein n=1 Tax=viral metagenome TaxID=1070528 RepID=A0A6M3J7B9_9ZZZZ